MQKFIHDYDFENDDLIVAKSGKKSTGSVEIGDVVLDFYKNELVAVEVMNASKFLGASGAALKNAGNAAFGTVQKNNWLLIKLTVAAHGKKLVKDFSVQNVTRQSPAVALA